MNRTIINSLRNIRDFFKVRLLVIVVSVHQLRIKRNLKKVRVIPLYFVVTQPNLSVTRNLIRSLRNNPRFCVSLVVMPNLEMAEADFADSMARNVTALQEFKDNLILGWELSLGFTPLDELKGFGVLFLEQLSDSIAPNYKIAPLAKRFLICYVPYATMLSQSSLSHYNKLYTVYLWRVFLETKWHKLNQKNVRSRKFVVAGTDQDYDPNLRLRRGNFTVLWCPHWSVSRGEYDYSTFLKYKDFFLLLSQEYKEIDWIFRPHQRLFRELEYQKIFSKKDIQDYIKRWNEQDNTYFSTDNDRSLDFLLSDCMITDSVSFLYEYLFTGKPLLHLGNGANNFNTLAHDLLNVHYAGNQEQDIYDFIILIESGGDPKREMRMDLKKRLCMGSYNSLTSTVVREFRSL